MRTHLFLAAPACASLLIALGLAVASPVFAALPSPDDVDLTIAVDGTTLTNRARHKVATVTVTNRSATTAYGVRLRYDGRVDSEVINPSSVAFCPPSPNSPTPGPPTSAPSLEVTVDGECTLPDLAPGQSTRLTSTIVRSAHGVGPVGEVTVRVWHGGTDPVGDNNSATASIAFAEGEPDLYARAWDGPADRTGAITPAVPGGGGDLRFEIGNHGTEPVSGMVVTVGLPAHVTFAGDRPGCTYDTGRRNATCAYPDLSLITAEADRDPDDLNYSALRFRHPLSVDPSAPAPARLSGGRLDVEPLLAGQLPPATDLPEDITGLVATDLDSTDDNDRFTVSTTPRSGTSGGLPQTGSPTALLSTLGLGTLATGSGLLLLTRRRPPLLTP
ncbi:LPXTG cell wall anchor domain-containing protein [Micromonospora sp. NPDC004704]